MCIAHLMENEPHATVIEAECAVELAPSFALAQNALGWSRVFAGAASAAADPIARAIRLNRRDPVTYFFHCALALTQFHLGEDEACVALSHRAVLAKPRYFSMLVLLAGLGRLGRLSATVGPCPAVRTDGPAVLLAAHVPLCRPCRAPRSNPRWSSPVFSRCANRTGALEAQTLPNA